MGTDRWIAECGIEGCPCDRPHYHVEDADGERIVPIEDNGFPARSWNIFKSRPGSPTPGEYVEGPPTHGPLSVVEESRLREAEAELARATTFTINLDADPSEWITVELTCVAGGGPHKPPHDTWAVRLRSYCLDVDGDWVHEPIPSSRDDEFLARTRWTREEALDRARGVLEKGDTGPVG